MPSLASTSFSTLSLTRPFISVPSKVTDDCSSLPSSQEEPFSIFLHKAKESWICCKIGNFSVHSPSSSILLHCHSLMCGICSLQLRGIDSHQRIEQAQIQGVRLITVRDLKFAAEPFSWVPPKKICVALCSHSQKYLQCFWFSLVWLYKGQIWYLHINWVTWFYLCWMACWNISDVSTRSKEWKRTVTRLNEAIKVYFSLSGLKYYSSFWIHALFFTLGCLQSIRRF